MKQLQFLLSPRVAIIKRESPTGPCKLQFPLSPRVAIIKFLERVAVGLLQFPLSPRVAIIAFLVLGSDFKLQFPLSPRVAIIDLAVSLVVRGLQRNLRAKKWIFLVKIGLFFSFFSKNASKWQQRVSRVNMAKCCSIITVYADIFCFYVLLLKWGR